MTVFTPDYRPQIGEVRTGPWLDPRCGGRAVDGTDDFNEARRQAGITWDVQTEPVYRPSGELIKDELHHFRSDNGYKLAVLPSSFKTITHGQIASVAGELIREARPHGGLKVTNAGELEGGRIVYFGFELGEAYKVPGDPNPIARHMTIFTAHNRSAAMTLIQNDIRYGCANAMSAAAFEVQSGSSNGFRIRHTTNAAKRLEEATDGLKQTIYNSNKTRLFLEGLSKVPFTENQWELLVRRFIPIEETLSKHKADLREATRTQLRTIYSEEANPNMAGLAPTAYKAVNAVVELEDHFGGYRNNEKRVVNTLGGGNVSGKARAWRLIDDISRQDVTKAELVSVL